MDRGHVSQELDRAEILIKEDPAYAKTVLDSLHSAEESLFDDPGHQARYILLNEYAKYRNGIDEKNDSLICIAEDYYMQHGTEHEKMLVLFLRGHVLFACDDYGSAMLKYAYAAEYAKACFDHFMLGQIYTNQYLLCADAFGANAIELAQAAVEEYAISGDSIYIMDGKTNLGIAYYHNRQYGESEACLLSAFQTANQQRDTFAMRKCVRFLAYLNNEKGEATIADSLFHELFNTYHDVWFVKDRAILSEVYAKLNKYDSALYYLSLAKVKHYTLIENRMQYLKSATRVFSEMSNYESALRCCQEHQSVSDSVFWEHLSNSVMREQRDFVQEKLTQTEQTNDYLLFSIFGLAVLLAFVTLSLSYIRMRGLREQEKRIAAETELELKNQCIQNSIRGIKKSAIVEEFNNCLTNDHRPTQGEWNQLSDLFSEMLPNFEKRLRDAVDLREEEWNMCMLQKLDFKAKEIELLTGINPSVTSNRLAKKGINVNSGATEWRQFLKEI